MQPSFTCLQSDELKKFIAGEIAPKRVDEIEDHLSTCETCRSSLEATVGDQAWWQDLESALRSDAADGEYENTESKESVCRRLTALFGPTDDPSMLGRIGAYEIIGLLGYGGMGAVFKARDPGLNRYVAVKILLPHLALSGAARARFRREGQAAAAIIDDCVLPIYAVDEWQGIPYLVMQYTQGVSLQKRIHDRGPLELKEILRIGLQAARGLAAAHAQGLVHRDVKPSNILLAGSVDRALLTDFGLARAVDDASLTSSGMIAGTPQYMSPEQARAETVDHRSDLFSLGSVMYAMCTGHAPFRAESSYSVLRLITDKEPRPIREVNPEIPDWLCSIIAKLMAKQVSDRFISANQVAELFQVCLAHLQSPTTTALPAEFAKVKPERSSSKFHQLLMGVFAMCCLSLLAILLVMQNVDPTTQTGPSKLEKSSQPSQSGNPLQVVASAVGQSSEAHQSIADDSVLMVSVDSILPASDKGHPFIVKNSSIVLPSLDKPIVVSGRSTSEIESAISKAYLQQLKVPTKARIHEVRATSQAKVGDSVVVARTESDQPKGIEAAKRLEQQAQEIANLPRFYLYANYVSAWLDGMSDEAERSEANFEKAMNERLKPDTPSSTRITAWDEKRFLFGYDKPNLDGARGNTRIVNHYFSHEDSIWQRQKTNKDAPQYSKLELPYVWKKVDANSFFHLRSARLEFPWGNTDGNIKFALVPLEFAEYQVVGEETVDGTECWVVMSKPRRCKLWLDQKSGRLLQMLRYVMQGVESTPFQETPEVEKLCGRKFDTLDAFHEFGKATDRATFQRLAGLYGSLYFDELAHPIELTRFSDYREIAPGIWFPHQAIDVFAGHSPSDNNKFRFSRGELRVITLETGRSLEETIAAFVSEKSE